MSDTDVQTSSLMDLWCQSKRLMKLYGEYVRLVMMEKIIVFLSALTLTFLLVGLGMMILFYIGGFSVQLLATATGSLAVGHIIVAGVYLAIGCCIYLLRERLIVRPLTRFVYKLFNL